MHILFLTDNFPPEVNAPASRTFEHCREWVRAGERVTVITGAPNFPQGKLLAGYRNALWQQEEVEGIRVIRVWTYITANEGFVKRILDYQSFMVAATLAALFVRKVDVVVGTSPQLFTTCAAFVVSLLKRVPFVFELRDLWPESIKAVGAISNNRVLNWLERLELFLYRRATLVVSVTQSFKRNLTGRGIPAEKIVVVTNGVDVGRFKPQLRDDALSVKFELQGKFVAGYVGTHGLAHGLDTLLDAAQLLEANPAGRDIRLLFLGDGANKKKLVARAAELGLSNVVFIASVPKDEVPRYWSLLDVSIIHLKRTELFTTVIPSKLFECMGMGIPVLHGVAGESADIVVNENCGLVFEPENAVALCDVLTRLMASEELRGMYARNGLKAARLYDRKEIALRMLGEIRQVAHSASSQA